MEPPALRDALVELARECGIAVRVLRSASDAPGLASGPALVRGAPWAVLVVSDTAPAQIRALAAALLRFRAAELDARFLPPAVREVLDGVAAEKTR